MTRQPVRRKRETAPIQPQCHSSPPCCHSQGGLGIEPVSRHEQPGFIERREAVGLGLREIDHRVGPERDIDSGIEHLPVSVRPEDLNLTEVRAGARAIGDRRMCRFKRTDVFIACAIDMSRDSWTSGEYLPQVAHGRSTPPEIFRAGFVPHPDPLQPIPLQTITRRDDLPLLGSLREVGHHRHAAMSASARAIVIHTEPDGVRRVGLPGPVHALGLLPDHLCLLGQATEHLDDPVLTISQSEHLDPADSDEAGLAERPVRVDPEYAGDIPYRDDASGQRTGRAFAHRCRDVHRIGWTLGTDRVHPIQKGTPTWKRSGSDVCEVEVGVGVHEPRDEHPVLCVDLDWGGLGRERRMRSDLLGGPDGQKVHRWEFGIRCGYQRGARTHPGSGTINRSRSMYEYQPLSHKKPIPNEEICRSSRIHAPERQKPIVPESKPSGAGMPPCRSNMVFFWTARRIFGLCRDPHSTDFDRSEANRMRQFRISGTAPRLGLTAVVLGLAGLSLGGCVAQGEYDTTTTMVDSLEAQNARLLQEKQTAESIASRRAERIGELEAAVAAKDRQIGDLSTRLDGLTRNLGDLEGRLGNVNVGPALDAQTDLALRQLAARYPDLLQYDAQKGMIRVASDLTFNSGSDSLRDGAQEGLRQLARALSGDSASGYALRVVGHTDNQPISNPATRQRFANNRILSVFRAIAVSEALQAAGFPAGRIEVAGWGPHRPAVRNNPTGGTAANRRVEIFVVPMTDAPLSDAPAESSAGREIPQRPAPTSPDDFPIK